METSVGVGIHMESAGNGYAGTGPGWYPFLCTVTTGVNGIRLPGTFYAAISVQENAYPWTVSSTTISYYISA
jgi:hypothetical protein